jgi:hypothetical protein
MRKRYFEWLPRRLEALAPWFANFALKFDEFSATLGFAAADVTKVQQDAAVVQWLADAIATAEANLRAFRDYRDEILYNEKGDAAPVAPPTGLPAQPAVMTAEIVERLDKLVNRIRLADNYTQAIGEALGIVPATGGSVVNPANLKPQIQLFPSQTGFMFTTVVSLRGDADMFEVQIRRAGSESWQTVKSGTGKSVDVTVAPTAPGTPEKLEARVILLRKNQPYGQPSDPAYVTVSP